MSKEKECWVYWIHLIDHTDIFTQGYVGITTIGVHRRYLAHKNAVRAKTRAATRITNAIKKYGAELVVDTILYSDLKYCQEFETKLRPKENIGWNLAIGGAAVSAGRKNSLEHIKKVADANRGRKHSEQTTEANRQRGLIQFTDLKDWLHPVANKSVWAECGAIYSWYLVNPKDGRRTVGKALNLPSDSVLLPLRKIKAGWNPNLDTTYLEWLKQYNKECPNGT